MGEVIHLISFFLSNCIYLSSFYFACSILTYSEKKDSQAYLASFSFLCSSVFFIGHQVILTNGIGFILNYSSKIIYPSFLILSVLPFAWSILVFRFYKDRILFNKISLRKTFVSIEIILLILYIYLMLNYIPDSSSSKVAEIFFLIPEKLFYFFSFYIFLITSFSILYIFKIRKVENNIHEIAKNYAYNSILTSSTLLWILSILVSIMMIFGKKNIEHEILLIEINRFPIYLLVFDSFSSLIIFLIILIIGQAIISYQVFTGRFLAMESLKIYWKNVLAFIILTSFLSTIAYLFSYKTDLKQIFLTLIGILFFIQIQKVSKRIETENRKFLKPFLFNENLHESITNQSDTMNSYLENTFNLLCNSTLQTTKACLLPIGAISSFIPRPIFYPKENSSLNQKMISFIENLSPNKNIYYLNRNEYEGYLLAILIKDSKEEIGFLFLGIKENYTLYSEEEIEIAKIGSSKILDILSVTEISRLLVSLQKKKIMDSKLIDLQTRRILHDDILPEIHTLMIHIDSIKKNSVSSNLINSLSLIHKKISALLKTLPIHLSNLTHDNFIQEIKALANSELHGEKVLYFIDKEAEEKLSGLEIVTLEVGYYAVRELLRNILKYARIENRFLEVKIYLTIQNSLLELIVEDNGNGFKDTERNNIGTGQGLLLQSTMMAVIGGALIKESVAGKFFRVRLILKKYRF